MARHVQFGAHAGSASMIFSVLLLIADCVVVLSSAAIAIGSVGAAVVLAVAALWASERGWLRL